MKREEFLNKIKLEGLISIYDDDVEKVYMDFHLVYDKDGNWINNTPNIYSCFEKSRSEFIIFFTDDERGIPNYLREFDNEDAAYDALYKRLKLLNEIYKEDHGIK